MRVVSWLGALALVIPAVAVGQEAPRDDAAMVVEYRKGEGISVVQLLQAWGNKFDAPPLIDPALHSTKVRFLSNTDRPMTWGTVKKILAFHGVVVTVARASEDGHWLIRAMPRTSLNGLEPGGYYPAKELPAQEDLITAVFQIEHGAGQMIFTTVRTLQGRDPNRIGNSLYVSGPEVLILVDLTSRVRYFQRVIEALDVPGPRKRLEIYQIRHARAPALAEIVLRVMGGFQAAPRPGNPIVPGRPSQAPLEVIADERTNRLAVAAFPMDIPRVERVIREFDLPVDEDPETTHVYAVNNADPKELEERLRALFAKGDGQDGDAAPAGRPGPGRSPSTVGPPTRAQTVIVADVPSNRLVIQAEERTYQRILGVLGELDRRPARVHVEVIVYEVSTPTDQMTVGFEIAGLTNAHEGSTRPAGGTNFGLSQVGAKTDADGNVIGASRTPNISQGLTGFLTRGAFDRIPILMTAVHNYERTRIVDRSETMTNDNKEATFEVSNSAPFLKATVNDGVTTTSVESADATTKITVTPRVNSERDLTLNFTVEISTFSGSGSVNLPPGKNTRRYTAEAITVPNQAYVMFGGLESETEREVEVKVPFLGDIPLLGYLFKTKTTDRSRSRLYIFVRPTILDDESFGPTRRIAAERLEKIRAASGHDPWLPAVSDRILRGADYTLQDEAIETFGTGSANPFNG